MLGFSQYFPPAGSYGNRVTPESDILAITVFQAEILFPDTDVVPYWELAPDTGETKVAVNSSYT